MKEIPVLNNRDEFPGPEIIRQALGEKFIIYDALINSLTQAPLNLNQEWRFYNDGKSWLSKITLRKKTILWLSIFEGYFKIAFYFSAKTSEGIEQLEIDENIKSGFDADAAGGDVAGVQSFRGLD